MKRVASVSPEDPEQALVLKQARTGNGSVENEVNNSTASATATATAASAAAAANHQAPKTEESVATPSDNGNAEDDDDGLKITDTETFNSDRYKAFTMLVRHCVDCNLDRMTPISQQPRHKIEEIARACTRQFPEFSEQLCRSRIRSYLKSSRRNGKKHGGVICEKKRSLPSTLTSPAAERLFEQALKLELENQERIAKGLEPIQAPLPSGMAQPIIPLSTLNPEPEAGLGEGEMPPPPPSLTIGSGGSGGKTASNGSVGSPVAPLPQAAATAATATNLCKADVERQLLASSMADVTAAAAASGIAAMTDPSGAAAAAAAAAAVSASGSSSLLPDPVQVQLLSLLMPQLLSCAAVSQSGTTGVAGMQNFVRECRSVSTFLFAVAEFWEAMLKGPATVATNSAANSCATSSNTSQL